MTKEELKQEAEESLDKRLGTYAYIRKQDCYIPYVDGYTDGAEPREKQIQVLGERCLQLQKDKGNLIDRVRVLEQQIEKMKSDVMANIKWADKNCDNMWQKLVKMWNQWEIKENDN